MSKTPKLAGNALIASMPRGVRKDLSAHLQPVQMPLGQVIYQTGEDITHLYFPVDCVVSLLKVLHDGATSEIALVGKEGVVGMSALIGDRQSITRAVVQNAGIAYRCAWQQCKPVYERSKPMQARLLRYNLSLFAATAQTAACIRYHSVEQQMCRWLLSSLDRLSSNVLEVTQELIASMLGVRRECVTQAAGRLQTAGLIRYQRGHITVIDRPRLEIQACECYDATRLCVSTPRRRRISR